MKESFPKSLLAWNSLLMRNSSNQPLKKLLRYNLHFFFLLYNSFSQFSGQNTNLAFIFFFFLLGTIKDVKMILKLIYIIIGLTGNFSSKILSLKLSQSEPWQEIFSLCVYANLLQLCSLRPYGLYPAGQSLSMGFSRQEYWSGLPSPSPGDLPDPGMEPASLTPELADEFFTTSATWEAPQLSCPCLI